MNALTTHRKCMVCGETTTNLAQEKCRCGAYMFMMGQYYTPKIGYREEAASEKKKQ